MSSAQKILVTGGTGLLGSHLLRKLLQDPGLAVRALYRQQHPDISGVEWVQADMLDIVALDEAMAGIEKVYHCAASVDFHRKNARSTQTNNINGTANVVNAALANKVSKLLFVSSVAAIGGPENTLINEKFQWNDKERHSPYAESKYGAEMEVWRGQAEGLEVVIVNPSVILGAGDWTKGSTEMFRSVYDRFPWYTDGIHGFVDVLDVIDIMVMLMGDKAANGQRFILNADNISYKQLFDRMADGFGIPRPHKKVTKTVAALMWRWKSLQGWLTGRPSLLTKETAHTAMAHIRYDNRKILDFLPTFQFRPLSESIDRICRELVIIYQNTVKENVSEM